MDDIKKTILRKTQESPQDTLFDMEPDWREHWWNMPSFDMKDATPRYKICINFMTEEDLRAFADITKLSITTKTKSSYYPSQDRLTPGEFFYDGPKSDSKYPICIPSKGRADCQQTGKALDRLGTTYKFFVEETEYEEYCEHIGEDSVVCLPFNNLGQGSVPARNYIWEWAKEREYKRHWTVDDNIIAFCRMTNNRRPRVYGGGFFRAMENFVDRYENVAMAGPHNRSFATDRSDTVTPYLLNSRVYSCILLDTTLPHRWRGRYNEDTDLSLRLLKEGHCTVLFRSLLMSKSDTVGARNAKPMKGGNTDNVYNTDDHRLAFAKSLQEQHPDCVEVTWKFNR